MKTIGKYQVLEELGSSAAGATYRVRDKFRDRELALKVLDSSVSASGDMQTQFNREVGTCVDLRHPHIVEIRDVGEADGAVYIATELLRGIDLRGHLKEKRVLTLPRKIELMAQVCDGLSRAHRNGIAHGNIKPSNIFVVDARDARILDFGVGRWVASILAAGGRLTDLVPNHFAPEQVLGQPFDARSDIFSVAMVLYELLVDKYPFPVPGGLVIREIVHTEPEPLRKLDPQIPEELERLVVSALKKNPHQRLQTAEEFAAGLHGIAQALERGPAAPAPAIVIPVAVPPAAATPAVPESKPEIRPATPAPVPVVAPKSAVKLTAPAPPLPAARRAGHFRNRVITYTAAAVLALVIAGTFVSRQSMRASQAKAPAPVPAVAQQITVPIVKADPVPPPQDPAPVVEKPAVEAPAVEAPVPQRSQEQIHIGRVKSLWELGKYSQAMALVDQVLADNPDSTAARSWKKKIRAAQQAESEIK